MTIEYKPLKDIKPYVNNAKLHPKEQVEQIKRSIQEFGFNDPIAIDEHNVIIEGHGRFIAVKELGYTEVPVIQLSHLTEAQKRAYIIAHNKLTLNSDFDIDLIIKELEDIKFDIDITLTGFDDIDTLLNIEPDEVVEDDFEVEVPTEPKSKIGDLWLLDNHRVLCGDSTDDDTVKRLIDGNTIDVVFTDPPYGMKKENDGVLNDNMNYDDLLSFNKLWITLSFKYLKKTGSWYCWGIDEPLMDIYSHILKPLAQQNKLTFRNLITWDKGNGQGQNSELTRSYAIADEKCLFVMAGVQGFNNNQDNYYDGWESIRLYLNNEMEKVGGRKDWAKALGNQMGHHYFTKSQWVFPTYEAYNKLQQYAKGKAFKKEYDELKKEYDELKKEWYKTRAYFDNTHDNMNNVWHFDRTKQAERTHTGGHATPKPIDLCSRAIKSSSQQHENVLDLFGGSGSTLIACEQLNRQTYIMELSTQYIDVIVQRYKAFKDDANIRLMRDGNTYTYDEIFGGDV
jgi:DNA modification methylase